jgi:tryptophan-rich sensory protein
MQTIHRRAQVAAKTISARGRVAAVPGLAWVSIATVLNFEIRRLDS